MNGLSSIWMLLVVSAVSWVLANILVVALSPLLKQSTHPATRGYLWLLASLPSVVPLLALASLGFLALAKTKDWINHHCGAHIAHHPHFCLEHLPEIALELSTTVAAVVLVLAALAVLVYRWSHLMAAHAKSQSLSRLANAKGLKTTISEQRPMAFTLGVFRPTIYLSTGLKKLMSLRELRVVFTHEAGHVRNRDVFKNLVFEALLSLHAFPNLLRARWYLCAELHADDYAAKKLGALDVAEVLVKLNRVSVAAPYPASIGGSQLSVRVRALTSPQEYQQAPALALRLLPPVLLVLPFAVMFGHHALETIWGWLL